jgi:polar amino acid transport system permease protein
MSLQALYLLMSGAIKTIQISIASIGLSLFIALVVGTTISVTRTPPLRWVLYGYIELFRGTSLVVQLFWLYFVLPHFGVFLSELTVAIAAISLNYGAYGAIIVRGALVSLSKAQWEAAHSLGMPRGTALRKVIFPQVAVFLIKPMGVLYIQLIKATSLVSLITIPDLTYRAYQLNQLTMRTFEIFGLVLVIYFVLTKCLTLLTGLFDRHIGQWRMVEARR